METINNTWKLQSLDFNNDLNKALQQQHHAAQFIALVGKHLIFQESDDSNTNMEFVFGKNTLVGNEMQNGFRLSLDIINQQLSIINKDNTEKKLIVLEGKNKNTVFNELAQNLADLGVNVTDFKNELHYEIPKHVLDNGAVFTQVNPNDFTENAKYRHNAKIVLNEVAQLFNQDEAIRIWPHHFDTGAFYVVKKNDTGEATQTIGIGFAIPDSMINEPYYYLSFWSEKQIEGADKFANLLAGKWMMPDWNGAVL
ncbi:MAG: hypothetical protein QM503_05880, partial [Bacteroidota bacterium]